MLITPELFAFFFAWPWIRPKFHSLCCGLRHLDLDFIHCWHVLFLPVEKAGKTQASGKWNSWSSPAFLAIEEEYQYTMRAFTRRNTRVQNPSFSCLFSREERNIIKTNGVHSSRVLSNTPVTTSQYYNEPSGSEEYGCGSTRCRNRRTSLNGASGPIRQDIVLSQTDKWPGIHE